MENRVGAVGAIRTEGIFIIRIFTYLQWGDSEESLGSVVMFNPAPARFKSEADEEARAQGHSVRGELKLHPTMKQLARLVERIYPLPSGRLYLYNLFPVESPSKSYAKKLFAPLYQRDDYLVTSPEVTAGELKQHPWILLGWGCDLANNSLEIRNRWLELIEEAKIPIIGLEGKREGDFRHPCPRLKRDRVAFLNEFQKRYSMLKLQAN